MARLIQANAPIQKNSQFANPNPVNTQSGIMQLLEFMAPELTKYATEGTSSLYGQGKALVQNDPREFAAQNARFNQMLYGKPNPSIQEQTSLSSFLSPKGGAGRSLGEAVWIGLVDGLTRGLGSKLLGPTMEKIGLKNIVGPKRMKAGAETIKSKVGTELGNVLTESTEKGVKIPTKSIMDDIYKIRNRVLQESEELEPKAVAEVDKIIESLMSIGDNVSPVKAEAVKRGLDKTIYGQAGKELKTRGARGIAKKTTGEELANSLRSLIREYVPESGRYYDEYADAAKIAQRLEDPMKGFYKGSIATALGAPFAYVNPTLGLPIMATSAGITAGSMPYTNLLFRYLFGKGMRPLGQVGRATVNELTSPQNEGLNGIR